MTNKPCSSGMDEIIRIDADCTRAGDAVKEVINILNKGRRDKITFESVLFVSFDDYKIVNEYCDMKQEGILGIEVSLDCAKFDILTLAPIW